MSLLTKSKFELAKEFYDKMGFTYPKEPTAIPAPRRAQLMAYLLEEVMELGKASKLTDQVDASIDLLYFVMDVFVEMGVDPDIPFNIVHQANMAKLWPDGQPIMDYSVVPPRMKKPDTWEAPEPLIHEWLNGSGE